MFPKQTLQYLSWKSDDKCFFQPSQVCVIILYINIIILYVDAINKLFFAINYFFCFIHLLYISTEFLFGLCVLSFFEHLMEPPLICSPAHELLVCIIFENILSWLLIIHRR